MSSTQKGLQLEEKIANYFQSNGYTTKRNVIVEGHSGSKHEIDVFAEKSDIVTNVQIIVECKAWNTPIEKDVVSKVHYVLNDIGAHKAIIVSLRGFRVGAKNAAEKLGIEIWGREEVKNRIGTVEISKIETGTFEKTAFATEPKISLEEATLAMEKKKSKRFGAEELSFIQLVYVPCYLFKYSRTEQEGIIRTKEIVKTSYAICDALEGQYYQPAKAGKTVSYEFVQMNIQAPIITPKVKSAKLRKQVEKAAKEYDQFVTDSAKLRRLKLIEQVLGGVGTAKISIDSVTDIYYPIYAGILTKEDRMRWIAVDGVFGHVNDSMSSVFNQNSTYIQQQIQLKVCPQCSETFSENAEFCKRCGSKLVEKDLYQLFSS